MPEAAKKGKQVQVGDVAPDFTLPSQAGNEVHLSDFFGKKTIILYFYPKDNSGGCTAEACAFRDNYEVFTDAGAEVIGVSSDSVETHQGFASRQKLPFILLSDSNGAVRKLYGVPATFGILPGRVTYVIDKQGIVKHIFSAQFTPERHIEEALKIIQTL
jgi:thioredoxin-dependent peroxiredoxin